MVKKKCPEGKIWDNLLRICIDKGKIATPQLPPPTAKIQTVVDPLTTKTSLAKSTGPAHVLALNQTLWISVILVTLGSILALTLWFVIFRRQTKPRGDNEDPVPEQEVRKEPTAKFHLPHSDGNGKALQGAADGSSPCHPLYQMNPKWEEGFSMCRDPARDGSKEESEVLPTCTTVDGHRVPLPATELGGTALVTTKTV